MIYDITETPLSIIKEEKQEVQDENLKEEVKDLNERIKILDSTLEDMIMMSLKRGEK